jgi:hypothetical protein
MILCITSPEQNQMPSMTETRDEGLHRLDIKAWPGLGLSDWKKWGFDPTWVIRTPPNHFFLRPKESSIFETVSEGPALVLKGEWYKMDERREHLMQKTVWAVYALGLVLFAGMLAAVSMRSGFGAVVIFVLMYLLLEGFPIFALRWLSKESRFTERTLPFNCLRRVAYLEKEGVILFQWDIDSSREGLAIGMTPVASEKLVKSIEDFLQGKDLVRRFKNETLRRPPSNLQK